MNVRKIMCAVDLSEDSKPIATYTAKMAKALGAKVLVIYAAPSLSQYVGFHVPPNTIETFVDEIISGADENMKAFVEENFQGVEAEGKVLVGYASEEILRHFLYQLFLVGHITQTDVIDIDLLVNNNQRTIKIDDDFQLERDERDKQTDITVQELINNQNKLPGFLIDYNGKLQQLKKKL